MHNQNRSPIYLSVAILIALIVGCSDDDRPTKAGPVEVCREDGLCYTDLQVGKDCEVGSGRTVTIDYCLWVGRRTTRDSALQCTDSIHGPYTFTVGAYRVIQGLDQGIIGMRLNGRRIIDIPPDLAYGSRGYPGYVPPNSWIAMDIELIAVDSCTTRHR